MDNNEVNNKTENINSNSINIKLISLSIKEEEYIDKIFKVEIEYNDSILKYENIKIQEEKLDLENKLVINNDKNSAMIKLYLVKATNDSLILSEFEFDFSKYNEDSFTEIIFKKDENEFAVLNIKVEFVDYIKNDNTNNEEFSINKNLDDEEFKSKINLIEKLKNQNKTLETNINFIEQKMSETFKKIKEKKKIKPKLTNDEEVVYKEIKTVSFKSNSLKNEVNFYKKQINSCVTIDKIGNLTDKKDLNNKEFSKFSSENNYLKLNLKKIKDDVAKYEETDLIKEGVTQLKDDSNKTKEEIKKLNNSFLNKEKIIGLLISIYINVEKSYRDTCSKYSLNDALNLKVTNGNIEDFKEITGNPKEKKEKVKIENKLRNPIVKAIREEKSKIKKFDFEELEANESNFKTLISKWKDMLHQKRELLKNKNISIENSDIFKKNKILTKNYRNKEFLIKQLKNKEKELKIIKKNIIKNENKIKEQLDFSEIYYEDTNEKTEISEIKLTEKNNILGKKYEKKFEETFLIENINISEFSFKVHFNDTGIVGISYLNNENEEKSIGNSTVDFKEISLKNLKNLKAIYSKGITNLILNEDEFNIGRKLVNLNSKKVEYSVGDTNLIENIEVGYSKSIGLFTYIKFNLKENTKEDKLEDKKEDIIDEEKEKDIDNGNDKEKELDEEKEKDIDNGNDNDNKEKEFDEENIEEN